MVVLSRRNDPSKIIDLLMLSKLRTWWEERKRRWSAELEGSRRDYEDRLEISRTSERQERSRVTSPDCERDAVLLLNRAGEVFLVVVPRGKRDEQAREILKLAHCIDVEAVIARWISDEILEIENQCNDSTTEHEVISEDATHIRIRVPRTSE